MDLLLPHRLPGPPIEARLVARENRFLARCRTADGAELAAHVPDRGRLVDVLVPGARVLLFRASGEARRTAWSLLAAEEPASGVLVAIDPAGANARARALVDRGVLPEIGGGWTVRPEVRVGDSRFDFELTRGSERLLVEVKSVGVVRDGVALFPDAPTERGARHLEELDAHVRQGGRAAVILVAQRGDARAIRANELIDPAFAATLARVRRRLIVAGATFSVAPEGLRFEGIVPVL